MKLKLAALALAFAGVSAPVAAQVEGNVTLSTNYVFRGITQTDDGPAISGGFDVATEDGFYAGVWGSSVDFSDGTTMELDLYGGYAFAAGGFDWDVGLIYYAYPDSPEYFGESQDFLEIYGGVGRSFEAVSWDAKLSYSDDFYLGTGPAWYLETGLGIELVEGITADARIGASVFDDLPGADYEDWQLGLSGEFVGVGWDLRYHDTSDFFGDAFVFSISQSFGG